MARPKHLPLPLVDEGNVKRGYRTVMIRCMGRLVRVTFYATHAYEFKVARGRPFSDDQLGKAMGDVWGWGWKHTGVVGTKLRHILCTRGIINDHGHLVSA